MPFNDFSNHEEVAKHDKLVALADNMLELQKKYHEARIALAVELYREGKMTLKQAADTAKLTLWDFLYELGKRKISYTNITVEDLQEELGKI
ncbi:MAG: UPF0175 family protein [Halobacteriota archaeon]